MRKGREYAVLGIVLILVILAGMFVFMVSYSGVTGKVVREIENPVVDLSVEQAVEEFNEDYIYYLLDKIGARELRSGFLSSEKPTIEISVEGEFYNAIVDKGEIFVSLGRAEEKDIVIFTTKEEIVSMLKYEDYTVTSFEDGKSNIELVAGKSKLFSKGYLNLYKKVTGREIIGGIFGIYSN
ncbi:MAG: hypothetical protein AABW80_05385 [Nanoarchaeota archaeon]